WGGTGALNERYMQALGLLGTGALATKRRARAVLLSPTEIHFIYKKTAERYVLSAATRACVARYVEGAPDASLDDLVADHLLEAPRDTPHDPSGAILVRVERKTWKEFKGSMR